MKNENNTSTIKTEVKKQEEKKVDKTAEIKKKQQKAQLERFKSQYFEYYDDIKISDRQDW
jgi:hypothetical protein